MFFSLERREEKLRRGGKLRVENSSAELNIYFKLDRVGRREPTRSTAPARCQHIAFRAPATESKVSLLRIFTLITRRALQN